MIAPLSDDGPDVDAIRERLQRMSDEQLAAHGQALKYMTSPEASHQEIRATYRVQLREARREWKWRRVGGSGIPTQDSGNRDSTS